MGGCECGWVSGTAALLVGRAVLLILRSGYFMVKGLYRKSSCHVLHCFLQMYSTTTTTTPSPPGRAGVGCPRHVTAMLLPCYCHATAMPRPCHCHATAMLPPCYCHATAMLPSCYRHATAMPLCWWWVGPHTPPTPYLGDWILSPWPLTPMPTSTGARMQGPWQSQQPILRRQ